MLSLLLMPMLAAAAEPVQVTLNSQDRWALLRGLHRELGSRYLIHNLANAKGDCAALSVCETVAESVARGAATTDPRALIASSRVGDQAPATIVSMRGAYGQYRFTGRVFVSVYHADAASWRNYVGTLATVAGGPGADGSRRLINWREVDRFPLPSR
ncbi:hypothetical protein SAMN06297144_1244 [Sphingomonas guangdongensis]|uniref:Uncharacterized protein n=1 Tax=Sphingomonas guangdongensis TaxID=1141890 RepID=A0A285QL55_9SPHN|nr:hypothetical protein [Sphingomonas guangdongensis]SOB80802.1 hypothetical protein SAMN06297144_1244 [Sphingomonas guangdongensis]